MLINIDQLINQSINLIIFCYNFITDWDNEIERRANEADERDTDGDEGLTIWFTTLFNKESCVRFSVNIEPSTVIE